MPIGGRKIFFSADLNLNVLFSVILNGRLSAATRISAALE